MAVVLKESIEELRALRERFEAENRKFQEAMLQQMHQMQETVESFFPVK